MALFPEMSSVEYARPLKVEIQHKTLVSTFDDLGVEKRKQKWLYPKRTVTLGFNHITKAKMQIVFAFYIARSGSYEAFNFFMPTLNANPYTYVGEYVGTGDGSTTVFNLPCRTSSGRTLYLDAAAQSDGGVLLRPWEGPTVPTRSPLPPPRTPVRALPWTLPAI